MIVPSIKNHALLKSNCFIGVSANAKMEGNIVRVWRTLKFPGEIVNKNFHISVKTVAAILMLMVVLLSSCSITPLVPTNTPTIPTTICHSTGDQAKPYQLISVTRAELDVHIGHAGDIIPAPVSGCPTNPVVIDDGKILVCHAIGSKTNPYEEIRISLNGLNGHATHEGDIYPTAEGVCPTSPVETSEANADANAKITICHATNGQNNPYNEISVSVNGLNGHDKHEGDIIPAPSGGCPTSN